MTGSPPFKDGSIFVQVTYTDCGFISANAIYGALQAYGTLRAVTVIDPHAPIPTPFCAHTLYYCAEPELNTVPEERVCV
jgi:hypothetical protein